MPFAPLRQVGFLRVFMIVGQKRLYLPFLTHDQSVRPTAPLPRRPLPAAGASREALLAVIHLPGIWERSPRKLKGRARSSLILRKGLPPLPTRQQEPGWCPFLSAP